MVSLPLACCIVIYDWWTSSYPVCEQPGLINIIQQGIRFNRWQYYSFELTLLFPCSHLQSSNQWQSDGGEPTNMESKLAFITTTHKKIQKKNTKIFKHQEFNLQTFTIRGNKINYYQKTLMGLDRVKKLLL